MRERIKPSSKELVLVNLCVCYPRLSAACVRVRFMIPVRIVFQPHRLNEAEPPQKDWSHETLDCVLWCAG